MDRPRLRNVERIPLRRGDEDLLVLRDPMGIADPLAIDAEFAPVLDALDGQRTPAQIRQSLLMGRGLDVALDDLEAFVGDLESAGLLDGGGFRARWAALHDAFFRAPERAPALAGVLYPENPGELGVQLARVLGVPSPASTPASAVLVPHGPIELVGPVLAPTLATLPPADRLDYIVVLGADHHPGLLPYTVLDKPYRTPLGLAACADDVVAALVRRVPWLEREAIRHRLAHSIEWSVLYLQHVYGDAMPPVVPLLCGATVCADGRAHDQVGELTLALESMLDGANALVCASAELTHAGPAYGRPMLDAAGLDAVATRDRALLDAIVRGRARDVLTQGIDVAGQGRPSGLPVLYTLAEILPFGARTEVVGYELVQPDAVEPGWIGLAGMTSAYD